MEYHWKESIIEDRWHNNNLCKRKLKLIKTFLEAFENLTRILKNISGTVKSTPRRFKLISFCIVFSRRETNTCGTDGKGVGLDLEKFLLGLKLKELIRC